MEFQLDSVNCRNSRIIPESITDMILGLGKPHQVAYSPEWCLENITGAFQKRIRGKQGESLILK